ncbi:chloride channel protein [Mucilaginibacter sabulilitoris]|uniref:Chloride channel protein n=1 Tax=Mucilaginibacter sabulilitoris TaxID=1173583 RepID=A0ABZ0TKK1_9SPHI|nr:chloride channel protein [Mucilaginibacter sabulilitoris]WPU93231.1 chloride channel protein [Mucilaginibacter sabulilitoris]
MTNKIGIPISPALSNVENPAGNSSNNSGFLKKRLVFISCLSVTVAMAISVIAKILIYLINLVTNISFYGSFEFGFHSPANNHLGIWVAVIPAIGGVLVGIMAFYGSKAIRGHGIPEAMEQILVNDSNIKPSITFLKPISSAIAIGTGGPFGAEGPIIATGGALGSTLGQLFKITANERKIILASGATAGMSAIFGTPIAAVFLAIELLLFEFSPKSILPVALACITGAAGHHLLFESGPVFPMPDLVTPSNLALGIYSFMGIIIGFLSLGITKIVYIIEDYFEELPIHWMWWPAIGGLAVGIIGIFAPHTLGVGYDNITGLLSGKWPLTLICSLLFLKFLSWAIALGSGTSGGTLAPLLTMGGAAGALTGTLVLILFPNSGVNIPMSALIGMSAMFAGASRAYLTSITFALEATMQSHALLPLLGACTAAYMVSFFLMENTIMTEKIARRGIFTPDSFEPDLLQKMHVSQVISDEGTIINVNSTIADVRSWVNTNNIHDNYFIMVNNDGEFSGTLKLTDIYSNELDPESALVGMLKKEVNASVNNTDTLRYAMETMSKTEVEVLPVLSATDHKVIGILSYRDIISAFKIDADKTQSPYVKISLKRQRMKMLVRGRKTVTVDHDTK